MTEQQVEDYRDVHRIDNEKLATMAALTYAANNFQPGKLELPDAKMDVLFDDVKQWRVTLEQKDGVFSIELTDGNPRDFTPEEVAEQQAAQAAAQAAMEEFMSMMGGGQPAPEDPEE
jgi:hypothetical protein